MSDLLGVTVDDLVRSLKGRRTRLPFEIGAFVALEVCERLLEGPAQVGPGDVRISADGGVTVYAPPNSATRAGAARSVVDVLARLLVAAGQGVPPALLDLVEHGPADGRWDLGRLRDELEATLLPLNRAAARRVLARMLRDHERAPIEAPGGTGASTDASLDAEVDALLGDSPSPEAPAPPAFEASFAVAPAPSSDRMPEPPPPAFAGPANGSGWSTPAPSRPPSGPPPPLEGDSTYRDLAAGPEPHEAEPPSAPPAPGWSEPGAPFRKVEAALPPELLDHGPHVNALSERPVQGRGAWIATAVFVFLLLGLVAAVVWIRPDVVDRILGRPVPEDPARVAAGKRRAAEEERLREAHRRRFGVLTVYASPKRAQVFRRVGSGPTEVENLPVGVAHEFLTVAEGMRPSRAVVAAGAAWEGDEEKRYELAMQAGEPPSTTLTVGESKLPREMGEPTGARGTVRVVTNPPGASVYQLIGFGDSVRVEDLRTDQPQELLVALDGYQPQRVTVNPDDWDPGGDKPSVTVEVALERTPKSLSAPR